jgi:hypothetical protein
MDKNYHADDEDDDDGDDDDVEKEITDMFFTLILCFDFRELISERGFINVENFSPAS